MNNAKIIKLIKINSDHWSIYKQLYQTPDVMKYIGASLGDEAVAKSFERLIEKEKINKQRTTQIILYNSKPVGLIQTKLVDTVWLLGVMIMPDYHGLGIAEYSHLKMIQQIKVSPGYKCDKHTWVAKCSVDNDAANKLYQKLGFSLISTQNAKNKTTNIWEK